MTWFDLRTSDYINAYYVKSYSFIHLNIFQNKSVISVKLLLLLFRFGRQAHCPSVLNLATCLLPVPPGTSPGRDPEPRSAPPEERLHGGRRFCRCSCDPGAGHSPGPRVLPEFHHHREENKWHLPPLWAAPICSLQLSRSAVFLQSHHGARKPKHPARFRRLLRPQNQRTARKRLHQNSPAPVPRHRGNPEAVGSVGHNAANEGAAAAEQRHGAGRGPAPPAHGAAVPGRQRPRRDPGAAAPSHGRVGQLPRHRNPEKLSNSRFQRFRGAVGRSSPGPRPAGGERPLHASRQLHRLAPPAAPSEAERALRATLGISCVALMVHPWLFKLVFFTGITQNVSLGQREANNYSYLLYISVCVLFPVVGCHRVWVFDIYVENNVFPRGDKVNLPKLGWQKSRPP